MRTLWKPAHTELKNKTHLHIWQLYITIQTTTSCHQIWQCPPPTHTMYSRGGDRNTDGGVSSDTGMNQTAPRCPWPPTSRQLDAAAPCSPPAARPQQRARCARATGQVLNSARARAGEMKRPVTRPWPPCWAASLQHLHLNNQPQWPPRARRHPCCSPVTGSPHHQHNELTHATGRRLVPLKPQDIHRIAS